jgi:hypothetical protein
MDGGSPGVGSSWHPSPLGCSTDFTDSTDPLQEGEPQISLIAQMIVGRGVVRWMLEGSRGLGSGPISDLRKDLRKTTLEAVHSLQKLMIMVSFCAEIDLRKYLRIPP